MHEGLNKISKSKLWGKENQDQSLDGQITGIDQTESHAPDSTRKRGLATWSKQSKLVLIALFIIFISIVIIEFDITELQRLIAQNQKLSYIISFSAIVVIGLTLIIPTAPITLLITLLIGPIQAIVITILGNILTAIIHYQLGNQLGDVMNFEEKKDSLPFKLGKLPVNSPLFLLIGRGLPGGPKGLSFVCGAYGVPIVLYLWTTFITELFGAVFIAYGGDELIKRL